MTDYTLGELAQKLGATLEGDAATVIVGVAALEAAGEGTLTYAESGKYREQVEASGAAAIIVGADFPATADKNLLRVERPKPAFVAAMELFRPARAVTSTPPRSSLTMRRSARVSESARWWWSTAVPRSVPVAEFVPGPTSGRTFRLVRRATSGRTCR